MERTEKDLEDALRDVGKRLASPPTDVGELLSLLNHTELLLSRVKQAASQSILDALHPARRLLVEKKFLGHPDEDVIVTVTSCTNQITRITAPDAPYDDDLMKEVFRKIVDAFAKLDDFSSSSFSKRVSILQTVAKLRSCVVMLDLECDALILDMFHIFLRTIRPEHSETVFNSMGAIMTVILEECEEISPDLISCLLHAVKNDNKDILPIARSLGERVIAECALKLKPYLVELAKSKNAFLSKYSNVVASICEENSDCVQPIDINAAADVMVTDNGELPLQPSSRKRKLECSYHGGQSKNKLAANKVHSDTPELKAGKPDNVSDLKVKKLSNRQAGSSDHLQGRVDHYRVDGLLGKEEDSSSKKELQLLFESDGETVKFTSSNPVEGSDKSRSKRVRNHGSELSANQCGGNEKLQLEGADGVEKWAIVTSDTKSKSKELTSRKGAGSFSQKQKITNIKHRDKLNTKKDITGEMSRKSSERPSQARGLDQRIVGAKIRVWWPLDKEFYEGIVANYDCRTKKHKIVYDDGDLEMLFLEKEQWEFVEGEKKTWFFGGQAKGSSHSTMRPDASSEPPSKKTKDSSNHVVNENNVETPRKSGTSSSSAGGMELPKHRGRPPKGGISNHCPPSGDNSLDISGRSKENTSSESKDGITKTDTKLRNEGEKLREDTSMA